MRSVGSFVLAAKARGDDGSKAAKNNVLGIHQDPFLLHLGRFLREGFHWFKFLFLLPEACMSSRRMAAREAFRPIPENRQAPAGLDKCLFRLAYTVGLDQRQGVCFEVVRKIQVKTVT